MADDQQVAATIRGIRSVRFTQMAVSAVMLALLNRIKAGEECNDGNDQDDLIVYEAILDTLNVALPPGERRTMDSLQAIIDTSPPASRPPEGASVLAMVTRVDDNGQVVIVRDELSPEAAQDLHDMLAARGHKQTYGIETYPKGGSGAVQARLKAERSW